MELFLFFLLIAIFSVCLAVGLWKGSFALWVVGCIVMMMFGAILWTEGVKYVSGSDANISVVNADVDRIQSIDMYTVLTNDNSTPISFFSQMTWYGGMLLLLFGAVLAAYGYRR